MAKVIEIHYSGPSVIIDKTEDDVFLMGRNNKIIIFSIYNVVKGVLFNYVSNRFKITKVVGVDIEGNLIRVSLIDKTIKWSNLDWSWSSATSQFWQNYGVNKRSIRTVKNRILSANNKKNIVENLHTGQYKAELYDKKGDKYTGDYHVHYNAGIVKYMTGSTFTNLSEKLYLKKMDKKKIKKTSPKIPKRSNLRFK